jgi:hypothetical protein
MYFIQMDLSGIVILEYDAICYSVYSFELIIQLLIF